MLAASAATGVTQGREEPREAGPAASGKTLAMIRKALDPDEGLVRRRR
jgi:hypothetical protein